MIDAHFDLALRVIEVIEGGSLGHSNRGAEGVALCPTYIQILMKIAKQVGFEIYYIYNLTPENLTKSNYL